MKKIGFCKQCLRNVPHILFFRWPFLSFLNRYPNLGDSLPLGSWHCCGCEKNSFSIKRPDPEVATDVSSTTMDDIVPWPDRTDPTQRFGLLFRRKKKTKVVKETDAESRQEEAGFEHVGNVTRTDDSLLVRQARAARYSKKFRDSVIDRILSGESTITQVRNELKLSERDLLDWINQRVMRQDQRIAKLTQVVDTVKQLTNDPSVVASFDDEATLKIHSEPQPKPDFEPVRRKGATVEGHVKRG
jgi:transposase-like protein